MRIKAADIKNCFTCRFADEFLSPEYDREWDSVIDVECSRKSGQWISAVIKEKCPHWEKKS